jgi:ABC-type antimicrobial peptide transport system permease subunit
VLGGIAVAAGGAMALVVADWIESLLYQTRALDPVSFGGAAVALITLALAAAAWPAYRAARTNTADILRQEG